MQDSLEPANVILEVFRERVLPYVAHRDGTFGESIDERLGFEAAPPPVPAEGEAPSWRHEAGSYGSTSERRLQELSTWRASIDWPEGAAGAFEPDRLCIRLVDGVSDSPLTRSVEGYGYVVISMGHLHWLELVFRIQDALAELGRTVGGSSGQVRTNHVGGADVGRALEQARPQARALIAVMLVDDIFWQSMAGMPLSSPSELLARTSSFIQRDGRVVLYPEELRRSSPALPTTPTPYSRKMAKLGCIYTVLHELEHVRLGPGPRSLAQEQRCDEAATMLSPLFVGSVEDEWDLAIGSKGVERVAARPAFFVSEQLRQLVALYLADEQSKSADALDHLRELGERRRRQAEYLDAVLRGDRPFAEQVRRVDAEFMIMPRAVSYALEEMKPASRDLFAEARRLL